jgi:hypothetical protein
VRHVARMGEMKNIYSIVFGKTEGMIHRHRWEDNIRMDL